MMISWLLKKIKSKISKRSLHCSKVKKLSWKSNSLENRKL